MKKRFAGARPIVDMTASAGSLNHRLPRPHHSSLATLYQSAIEQASLLSYLDTFKVMARVFLASLPLILLVRHGKGGAGGMAH